MDFQLNKKTAKFFYSLFVVIVHQIASWVKRARDFNS